MDNKIRKCQNDEELEDCATRFYKKALLDSCKCVPLNINLNKEDPLCITDEQLECTQNFEPDTITNCQQKCKGLVVNSYIKTETSDRDLETLLGNVTTDYNRYKGSHSYPALIKGKSLNRFNVSIRGDNIQKQIKLSVSNDLLCDWQTDGWTTGHRWF